MGHRRLNHAADVFCRMFGGWRLSNSFTRLKQLGSGDLLIDVLSGECQWNGVRIEPLPIAYELNIWFQRELQGYGIAAAMLKTAQLRTQLQLGRASSNRSPTRFYIDKNDKPIRKGEFISLVAQCRSEIVTDKKTYSCEYSFSECWPERWPEDELIANAE